MSQLDRVYSNPISMEILNSLNIPEVAVPPSLHALSRTPLAEEPSSTEPHHPLAEEPSSTEPHHPFSPTLSIDSGRWTGTALWPSTKYFVHGGPGFSIGILDSSTGLLERLPIPVPTLSFLESPDLSNFSLSKVTCLVLAGESQVWAGTEAGSLHVFDMVPGPRLTNHAYSKLPDPITLLKTEQVMVTSPTSPPSSLSSRESSTRHSLLMRTEVLAGSPNGNLTIISGESDERGGLRNVDKSPRKVLPLRGFGDEYPGIHCTALVSTARSRDDCYWCGCGHMIIILRRIDWKILGRLDGGGVDGIGNGNHMLAGMEENGRDGNDAVERECYVSQLVATELGVWSTVTKSSTLLLWHPKTFSSAMRISCFNSGPKAPLKNMNAEVTSLVYSDPLLLVGTQGGYLLIFSISKKVPESKNSILISKRTRHRSVTSLPSSPSMYSRTMVDPYRKIYSSSGHHEDLDYTFIAATHCCSLPVVSIHPLGFQESMESSGPSPPSHTLNIMVLFGSGGGCDGSVHLYEMTSSPLSSPMTSPCGGRVSSQSEPPSLSRRCNLQDLEQIPSLTLLSVSKGSMSYLPLQELENSQ